MRVIDFFDKGVADYPNSIAFEDGDEKLTYKEASLQTKRFANAIRGHGYGKGTHIGVYAPNSNYAFGEGGAGTFSDGKLTSRTKGITGEKDLIFATKIKAAIGCF